MQRLILDPALRAKLHNLAEHVELCDESGQIIGHFLPLADYKKLQCIAIDFPFTEDEIERRRHEKGGRTLAEIWKSLGRT